MGAANETANPLLYQVNTRVLLSRIARSFGRPASLDDIPAEALCAVASLGFEWIWLLGVWQTGAAGRRVSREHPAWREEFRRALPDLTEEDITGSPFAISAWQVDAAFGGDAALARLRERAAEAGLRLMLDFVPNHLAPDHPWATQRPGLFVQGSRAELDAEPGNWVRVVTEEGPRVLAHGRDPYFPAWPDTIQLDYGNPETQAAMRGVLLDIAARCDGLRCDMAMLLIPEVFERCWSGHLRSGGVAPFWPEAAAALRRSHPEFRLLAEVYWGLETTLLEQGFDWAYDKSLYDALRAADGSLAREILARPPAGQARLARFLENHDEPRAAECFELRQHKAAAILTFCAPGLRLMHQGQLEGARVHIPIHLDRGPEEEVDAAVHAFYLDLLAALRDPVLRQGCFSPLPVRSAWEGNPSHAGFIASSWSDAAGPKLLCIVNYQSGQGQCWVRLAHPALAGRVVALSDQLGPEHYARDGAKLAQEGLYVDLPGWGLNLFAIG